MKKKVTALLLTMVMVVSLTACGKNSEQVKTTTTEETTTTTEVKEETVAETTETTEVAATAESTELEAKNLVWASWSSLEDSTKDVISGLADSYNKKGGSQVEVIGWPWADTQQQLIIRSQGSEQLDMAQVDIGMFGALSEMDILVDFNELLGADYLAENYDAAALEVGNVNGKQVGMPWSIASIGMVYNPTLLAAVGYEEPPTTIEEFEACMKALKEYDPEIIPYGVSTKDATMATDFQPWLWTFGASLLDDSGNVGINSEKAAECVSWYKSLLDNEYIQMNIARSDARTLFAQGKMAFYDDAISCNGVAISNGVDEANLDKFIRPMSRPVLKAGDVPQAAMWGHLLVVFKSSEAQAQAADFIKHVVSEENALIYLNSNGMLPVLKSAIASDDVKNNAWASKWLTITENGRKLEFALMSNGGELNNTVVEELQAALLGSKEIPKALEDTQTRLEKYMQK